VQLEQGLEQHEQGLEQHEQGLEQHEQGLEQHEQVRERRESLVANHQSGIPRSNPSQYGYPARIACNGQHELVQLEQGLEQHEQGLEQHEQGLEQHEQVRERRESLVANHQSGIPRSNPAQYGYPVRTACSGQHELERGQARNPLQLTAIRQHESPHSNWIPCVPACRIESTAFPRHPRNRIRNRNPPGSPRPTASRIRSPSTS
jgi:hypothetical protein